MKKTLLLVILIFISINSFAQSYKDDIKDAEKAMNELPPNYPNAKKYYEKAKSKCPLDMRPRIEKKIEEVNLLNAQYETEKVPIPNFTLPPDNPNGSSTQTIPQVRKPLLFPYTVQPPQREQLLTEIQKLIASPLKKDIKAKDDAFFQISENRLQGVNRKREARFLYDSTLAVIKKSNPSEQLLSLHLRAALFYGWDLLDKKGSNAKVLDSAAIVIQQTINSSNHPTFNSAKWNFARSGFENLISQYYSTIGDDVANYKHKLLAADYMKKAVLLEPDNIYYWGSLYVYTRNFTRLVDTAIPQEEKNRFRSLSYSIADFMDKNIQNSLPGTVSVMLSIKLQLLDDKYFELQPGKNPKEALILLQKGMDKKENKWLKSNTEYAPIYMATLYNRMSEVYNHHLKDPILYKEYTQKAADTLVYFLKNNSLSQYRWTGWFRGAFDTIASNSDFSLNQNEKAVLYKSFVTVIKEGKDDYIKNENVSYAYLRANGLLANILISNKTPNDSVQALTYLANSIELFEQGSYLEDYSVYSEDYANYCKTYGQIIKLYVNQGERIMAKKYYDAMMKYFNPIAEKYRWDFYLMQHIIGASTVYGEFLYKQKQFKDAIPPLELASFEGFKDSTEYLVKIYVETPLKNQKLAESMTARSAIQSNGMKRFTIPLDCAGSKESVYVYIVDRAKKHPYKGISDQAQWFKEARGCDVPEDVISSFNKLQDIAWENNVSFQDLSVYALGAAADAAKTPKK